jgi:hypothetical protein
MHTLIVLSAALTWIFLVRGLTVTKENWNEVR